MVVSRVGGEIQCEEFEFSDTRVGEVRPEDVALDGLVS